MDPHQFEEVVADVLDGLPEDFAEKLDNVEVTVEASPTAKTLAEQGIGEGSALLGLYRGVPKTNRGFGYQLVMPDQIIIYRDPILSLCHRTGAPEADTIRKVVLHEIAHHFGMPDERLREMGY